MHRRMTLPLFQCLFNVRGIVSLFFPRSENDFLENGEKKRTRINELEKEKWFIHKAHPITIKKKTVNISRKCTCEAVKFSVFKDSLL